MFFYVINQYEDAGIGLNLSGGEIEIEKLPFNEVEIKRRELLPVFEQFHYSQQDGHDR
jgi:Breast carcinoma amplified sequence 3